MIADRAITGRYVGLTAAELSALRTQLETTRTALLTAHQSYSRPGFSFNRVAFDSVCQELAEVLYAQNLLSGNFISRSYADLSA